MWSGFGQKMLLEMGWRHGQPLGRTSVGITTPVTVSMRFNRAGLCTKNEQKQCFGKELSNMGSVKKMTPIPTIQG